MAITWHISRYLELLFAFASLYWLMQGGGVEAAIAFVGFLATFVIQDIWWSVRAEENKRNRKKDKKLFDELLQLMAADFVHFLRNHDHGNASKDSVTEGMSDFIDTWNNAEHEFINHQLETLREKLYQVTEDYSLKFFKYTYSERNGMRKLSDWLFQHNERVWRSQKKELNCLADEVADLLEALIRVGWKKL